MSQIYSDQQLQAYLDENLKIETMSRIEQSLRDDEALRERVVRIAGAREAGVHGLGEIWRRNRISCPTREQLGGYVLKTLEAGLEDYVRFHLDDVGCRICKANLEDLERHRTEQQQTAESRRRRYFQTSAGYLSRP